MSKSLPFQLNPGEQEIVHLHRHPIVLILENIPLAFLLLLPIVLWLYALLTNLQLTVLESPLFSLALTLMGGVYYLLILLFFLYNYFDFVLDIWVVTSERVINIEQYGLFNRMTSEQEIAKIQDITAEIKGLIPTLFNYGNVYVQTAAEKEHFVFRDVKHPQDVVATISKIMDASTKNDNETI